MSNAHPPVDTSVDDQTDADSAPDPTAIPAAATTNAPYEYRCPICGTEYSNELIARIHITRAEDSDHDHHNGLMPETDITVVGESGSVVGSVARHPDDLDPTALTVDDFPETISDPNRHVLTVAAHHPQETTRKTITAYACDSLEDSDFEVPAYRTVCSLLNRFYRPHVGGPGADEDETLDDLESKQQAIIIARIVDPDASLSSLAKIVGTANSYPSQVVERASHVLDRLKSKQDEHNDVTTAIRTELSDAAIVTLREQGLINDVEVSFELPQDNQTEASSRTNGSQDDSWGSPVDQHDVMTAAPGSQLDTTNDTDAATTTEMSAATEQVDLTGDTTDQSEPVATGTGDDDAIASADATQHETKLEELQANINFLQEALDRIVDPTTETDLLVAVLEQINQQCQQLQQDS